MYFISEVYWNRGNMSVNQDSISLQEVSIKGEKAVFAVVCDGIGGLWKGEEASGLVAERMTEWFYEEAVLMLAKNKRGKNILRAGIRQLYCCNEKMLYFAKEKEVKLGAAVTIFLAYRGKYFLWHSGDTRLYQLRRFGRNRRITRLTQDHCVPDNMLTRCIGSFAWRQPDTRIGKIRRKTVFLICTDGFRHMVSEERIKEALSPGKWITREQLFKRMREIAEYSMKHGEKDNISAVTISVG